MDTVSVKRIDEDNINYKFYRKRIDDWNKDKYNKVEFGKSFHAIYLGDIYLAAGDVSVNKDSEVVTVKVLNGSEERYVESEAFRQLTAIGFQTLRKIKTKNLLVKEG